MDFLVEEGLVRDHCAGHMVSFTLTSNGKKHAGLNQANMLMVYLAARKACIQDGHKPVLRFTYIDNFISFMRNNKMRLCSTCIIR
jgi:hypothetical protein